jgi:hypothetical protein
LPQPSCPWRRNRVYEKSGFTEIARTELPEAFPIMAVDAKF